MIIVFLSANFVIVGNHDIQKDTLKNVVKFQSVIIFQTDLKKLITEPA